MRLEKSMGISKVTYVMLTTEIYPYALWSVMVGFHEEGIAVL